MGRPLASAAEALDWVPADANLESSALSEQAAIAALGIRLQANPPG